MIDGRWCDIKVTIKYSTVRVADPDAEWRKIRIRSSIADSDPNPDPDPSDPYVFGPLGNGFGSISQRDESGSVSFYHQAKIVRKTLIPTVL
jgi:hypothetical protein